MSSSIIIFKGLLDSDTNNIKLPKRLQEVNVPVVSNKDCKDTWGEEDIFTPGNVCAGENGKGHCGGK